VATIISGALLPATASLLTTHDVVRRHVAHGSRSDPSRDGGGAAHAARLGRYTNAISERSYEQQEVEARMFNVVEQTLSSIPIVKAFGREERADARFRASTDASSTRPWRPRGHRSGSKVLAGLTTAAGTAAILWVGSQHVLSGRLTVGSLLVFVAYLGSLYGPLQSLLYSPSTIHEPWAARAA
jgi:ABC-type multidrug transport system fused ATPase/permease subunit